MKMRMLPILFIVLCFDAKSQVAIENITSNRGIKFEDSLNWEQIKRKAKNENKFIFVDAYATWCGPCKLMEQQVFINNEVGTYFNDKFISVRVQMDQTSDDNQRIKNWYPDAIELNKKYKITVLPTFLFFTSNGSLVNKQVGYKSVSQLIEDGKLATGSGNKTVNPYKKFEAFVADYSNGKKKFKVMPEMIQVAWNLGQYDLYMKLSKDYLTYLTELKKDEWSTTSNIEFLASSTLVDSQSPFFVLFYPNGERTDAIMKKKGYAAAKVNWVIMNEICTPFLSNFYKGKDLQMLMKMEPAWDSLNHRILAEYNAEYAASALLKAKCEYYRYSNNIPAYVNTFSARMQRRDMDVTNLGDVALINECAWMIFERSDSAEQINFAITWMRDLVSQKFDAAVSTELLFDTYANLIYKYNMLFNKGLSDEALKWETKALEKAFNDKNESALKDYRTVIEKMTKKEPTW
ncbi:hypothetical protein A4H97_29885 [Niastella yeongjuensis]|uniref:Thioredoxin-like fold domain-containing protein n=1 Tax=Niastella yeongjuensis TaxID=354355 RepID=A0A1V9EPH8_9BACT|nr:thioredoxin family protein [Niastella yeongjuensis]OQP48049.1 hypothetical protein A4H97_29885 [Niastella yeongjuensis]SEO24758.1 Thioredoxin-like [Niastella yeongjuensis]